MAGRLKYGGLAIGMDGSQARVESEIMDVAKEIKRSADRYYLLRGPELGHDGDGEKLREAIRESHRFDSLKKELMEHIQRLVL